MKFSEAIALLEQGKKIRRSCYGHGIYYFYTSEHFLDHKGHDALVDPVEMMATDWEEYIEPKRKVKRWQWLNIDTRFGAGFFFTEEEVSKAFGAPIEKLKKLNWTEMEFEE